MAPPTELRSPYIKRIDLVKDTIKTHSKLSDQAATDLAVHILQALNSIPERMR